jgi:predicted helicase
LTLFRQFPPSGNHYDIFGDNLDNQTPFIGLMTGAAKPFSILVNQQIADLNYLSPAAGGTFCLPLYRYYNGERVENITDWALELFRNHYDNPL